MTATDTTVTRNDLENELAAMQASALDFTKFDGSLSSLASDVAIALDAAKRKAADLEARIQHLQRLLSAPARCAQAQIDAEAAQERVTSTAAAVARARSVVANLGGIAASRGCLCFLAASVGGISAVVQAIARSLSPVDLEAPDDALQLARAELATAEASHRAALDEDFKAQALLASSVHDVARLDLELALRNIAPTVARVRILSGSDYWPGQDLRTLVDQAERTMQGSA